MRDLILGKDPADYTPEEWARIEGYNEDDVITDIALFAVEAPSIDVPTALFRGRYSKAVAGMEATGIPVDVAYIAELRDVWEGLRLHYIRQYDHLRLYDDDGHFHEDRFAALIAARGWFWPRTERAVSTRWTPGPWARWRSDIQSCGRCSSCTTRLASSA